MSEHVNPKRAWWPVPDDLWNYDARFLDAQTGTSVQARRLRHSASQIQDERTVGFRDGDWFVDTASSQPFVLSHDEFCARYVLVFPPPVSHRHHRHAEQADGTATSAEQRYGVFYVQQGGSQKFVGMLESTHETHAEAVEHARKRIPEDFAHAMGNHSFAVIPITVVSLTDQEVREAYARRQEARAAAALDATNESAPEEMFDPMEWFKREAPRKRLKFGVSVIELEGVSGAQDVQASLYDHPNDRQPLRSVELRYDDLTPLIDGLVEMRDWLRPMHEWQIANQHNWDDRGNFVPPGQR